jgi:hypothetical protein
MYAERELRNVLQGEINERKTIIERNRMEINRLEQINIQYTAEIGILLDAFENSVNLLDKA